MSPPLPRAALYARVSTATQDTALQLDELRAVARQRGWNVVGEYVDHGVSGARESRPALDRLVDDARRARLDVVAVWRFDRAARSTVHLLRLLRDLHEWGVDFVSLREAVDTTTPAGRMVFTFLGAVAEFERDLIRERVKAGLAHAKDRGVRLGRPPAGDVDVEGARAALAKGVSLRAAAAALGVSRTTLRRRLARTSDPLPHVTRDIPAR